MKLVDQSVVEQRAVEPAGAELEEASARQLLELRHRLGRIALETHLRYTIRKADSA